MTSASTSSRYSSQGYLISDLGSVVVRLLRRGLVPLTILLISITGWMLTSGQANWMSFAWISLGTTLALTIWRGSGRALPLLPVFAGQYLFAYGVPVVTDNETLDVYSPDLIGHAGLEVFIVMLAMSLTWSMTVPQIREGGRHSYMLRSMRNEGNRALVWLGFALVALTTAYNVADALGFIRPLLRALPGGTGSLVAALTKSSAMIGYFLAGVSFGTRHRNPMLAFYYWGTLLLNCGIIGTSLLLSSTSELVVAVVIGVFWGSGRLPWKFIFTTMAILFVLHPGKYAMRAQHWDGGGATGVVPLMNIPEFYGEWFDASMNEIMRPVESSFNSRDDEEDAHSMLARVNNMQNLAFAIDAVEERRLPTLDGRTYSLIPPLLMPRILWPNKPRAHEGQVLLNVHFERQSMVSAEKTYIAWGLLPEAYGNFGRYLGASILGTVMGFMCAWLERKTMHKPLLSMEGLLTIMLFTSLALSYEMVASVLVTSIFQSLVTISFACIPFMSRTRPLPPPSTEVIEDDTSITEQT